MIFITQKQLDQKVDMIMQYIDWREERIWRRMEDLDRQISDIQQRLYELRMKVDPEFKRQNTPLCGSGMTTMEPEKF